MTPDREEEERMTAVADSRLRVYETSAFLLRGPLTAADLLEIDLGDVTFEIENGALLLMSPPTIWHDATSNNIRHLLEPRHAHVGADLDLVVGENVRRPDVLGLSVPLRDLLQARITRPEVAIVELVVEIISHDRNPSRDRISVARDREVKFREYAHAGIREYWIVDEVADDPLDASVEMYRIKDGEYVPVRVVLLSELLAADQEKPGQGKTA
jgi:Uma2 family endonuclease